MRDAEILYSAELLQVVKGHEDAIRQRLHRSAGLQSFISELVHLLEGLLEVCWYSCCVSNRLKNKVAVPPPSYYSRVIEEINTEVGWDNIVSISNNLTDLTIKLVDESDREHEMIVSLTSDYPVGQPIYNYNLPEPVALRWIPGSSHIKDILIQV